MNQGTATRGVALGAAVLSALVVGWCADEVRSATARFERLTVEDGLSQGSVNSMAQDDLGFLWFGTQDGLNRFDGYGFEVYRHDAERPGSLAHNFVWDLLVGEDGSIWVATDGGGLDRFDPRTGEFQHHRHDPDDADSLPGDHVRALAGAPGGGIWVGTDDAVARLDPSTGKFHRLAVGAESLTHIRALEADRAGNLWVGMDGYGVAVIDPRTGGARRYRHDPSDPDSLSSDRIRAVLQGPESHLWIGTYDGGLNRVDPATGRVRKYSQGDGSGLAHDRVRALLAGHDGSIWVGTDTGLNRLRPGTPVMETYTHEPADLHSLSNDRILSLFQDRGGVLWVATQAGLSHWNPKTTWFEHIRQSASDPSGLTSNVVNAVSEGPDGRLWVGTFGGMSALDRAGGRSELYRNDPSDPSSLSDDRVMALRWSRDGALWVGTFGGGLNRLDPRSGRFNHWRSEPEDPDTLGSDGVTSILEDRSGRLWVGCYGGGLNLLNPDRKTVKRYRASPEDANSLSSDKVMVLAEDRGGSIWIGTDGGGLNRLDPETGGFERYGTGPGGLTSDVIWSVLEGRDGTLWIGTQGGGLLRWAAEDRAADRYRLRAYTERSGLPNEFVYGILEDEEGTLWLSTNRGLARFDPSTETFRSFEPWAGLQGFEFNFGAYHRSPSGEMFFGGSNGLNAFHPSRVRGSDYDAPVRITRIVGVEGPLALEVPPSRLEALQLTHRDRVIAFEFAALDYTAPTRTRYSYRLDGFDDDWIELGTTRRATYTNLPAGDYALRVRATHTDGTWNEAGVALPLTVLPPPWATNTAWMIYLLLVGAAVAGIVRLFAARNRRRTEYRLRLEAEVRERTRELADANAQLEEASLTDPLTGLRNRRYVRTAIKDEMAGLVRERVTALQTGRLDETPRRAVFVMMDLDGFKGVNDSHGHEAGDRVLLEVRDRILATCRTSDTLIRWGGDEFLLICRNTGLTGAERLADKVLSSVADRPIDLGSGAEARIGCSLGFAFFPFCPARPDGMTWETVQMMADSAMYEAKRTGKNRWVGLFHESDRPDVLPADFSCDLPETQAADLTKPDRVRIVRGGMGVRETS